MTYAFNLNLCVCYKFKTLGPPILDEKYSEAPRASGAF
jgi:hypothetical protein